MTDRERSFDTGDGITHGRQRVVLDVIVRSAVVVTAVLEHGPPLSGAVAKDCATDDELGKDLKRLGRSLDGLLSVAEVEDDAVTIGIQLDRFVQQRADELERLIDRAALRVPADLLPKHVRRGPDSRAIRRERHSLHGNSVEGDE